MLKPIILLGGGGHCESCIDVIEAAGLPIFGILDSTPREQVLGYPVIGDDDEMKRLVAANHSFLITVGQIKSPVVRIRLFEKIETLGGAFVTVLAPSAHLSKHAYVGRGTIVMHQAIVNVGSQIGENCIINNKALVEHDCTIGRHSHISTGALINGGCQIGSRVFIGSGAVLHQGVTICDDVVIGAGSAVKRSIAEPGQYTGNPAQKIHS